MACFSPLSAFRTDSGEIVFTDRGGHRPLELPCGQCIGCRLERSRQWAVRIMHEAQMHEFSSFVTLTYAEENIPYGDSLYYRDYQLFMKRLRKKFRKARFFMCGEYGERTSRPHYHTCLFGVFFEDRYPWRVSPAGFQLYRSPTLESLWDLGAAEIGDLSFESAAYVARYCTKKVTGAGAEAHYAKLVPSTGEIVMREPEFARMSLKPGIGAKWLEKYKADVYPHDGVFVNGHFCKPPRYYDRQLSDFEISSLEASRFERAQSCAADSSPDRLRARAVCARARLSLKRRSLE